jgi:hypothetical protein
VNLLLANRGSSRQGPFRTVRVVHALDTEFGRATVSSREQRGTFSSKDSRRRDLYEGFKSLR